MNDNTKNIDLSKPLKTPNGAESVPLMNWKALKYKIKLEDLEN